MKGAGKQMNITEKINGTHTVIANFADKVVLAYNPYAAEPYVVWYLDNDGDQYCGVYTDNIHFARHKFCERVVSCTAIGDFIRNGC